MLIKPVSPNVDLGILKNLSVDNHRYSPHRNKKPKPMLVLSYDDGDTGVYTDAFPVHQRFDVPGELSLTSGFLTGEITSEFFQAATVDNLKEMEDWGFEVVGHGKKHLRLGFSSFKESYPEGTTEVDLAKGNDYFGTHYPIHLWLLNRTNDTESLLTVTGKNEVNGKLILAEPLERFTSGPGSYITLSDAALTEEVKGCYDELTAMGFNVAHYSYPGNETTWNTRRVVKKYFNSARCGTFEGSGLVMTYNSETPINSYRLYSYAQLCGTSHARIDGIIDELVSKNGFAISYEHTWASFSVATLEYILTQCALRGVEVTTRSRALERFGNLLEIGDYEPTVYLMDEPKHYIINPAGKIFTNATTLRDLENPMRTPQE